MISTVTTFVTDNWAGILAVFAAVVSTAHAVVALTPTKADDEFLAKVEDALAFLGVKKAS